MFCLVSALYFSENLRIRLIAPGHIFYTKKEIRFKNSWMCNGDT
jgi:hypothetical protein